MTPVNNTRVPVRVIPGNGESMESRTVADIPDEELLRRAVGNARCRGHRKGFKHWRWSAVADVFALGSTYSAQLCQRFGYDPDEMVSR